MSRWKSIVVGICIILGGSAAALPFRQTSKPTAAIRTARQPDVDHDFDVTLQLAPISEGSPAWPSSDAEPSRFANAPLPTRVSLEGLEPPPGLAPLYESIKPNGRENDEQLKRAWISDGDTLQNLAERHLGSRDNWEAIYRANTDVLSSPDLLPIGTEIRIPVPSQVAPDAHGLVPVPHHLIRSNADRP